VRGDSRQDLYAKFLALAGLGLLAGVGALVDYWPTDVRVPRAANTIARLPAPAHALGVPRTPVTTLALAVTPARVARRSASDLQIGDSVISMSDLVSTSAETPVAFVTPSAPTGLDVASGVVSTVPAQPVTLTNPIRYSASDDSFAEPLRQYSIGQQVQDTSFFGDAVRVAGGSIAAAGGSIATAGGSIATAGAKAGESVAGAFRAAAGAVKHLKFF
jgi:hypothetical protein